MRFLVHPPEVLAERSDVFRAFISGPEGRVCPTQIEIDDNILVCRRTTSESGKLHVGCPVDGFGRPMVSTTSLVEREAPYLLAVELARGKISQIREQLGAWDVDNLSIPDEFVQIHGEAYRLFSQAAAIQDDPVKASILAHKALAQAFRADEMLSLAYTNQRLAVRHERFPQFPASLGSNLCHVVPEASWTGRFLDAFNAAVVPVEWRNVEPVRGEYHWETNDAQVQWCRENKLLMYGGPLLDFSPKGLPAWLWEWEKDIANLQSLVNDFVETSISRYVGRIRSWEVVARANTGGALALSEENRLELVANIFEAARRVDEEIQLLICVDQPWGDYQARGQHCLSPLQFVDVLVRSGVSLSGVNLEIGVGYRPRGTRSRSLLDLSRLIDQWSELGIALHVTVAFPSDDAADAMAKPDLEVDTAHWKSEYSEATQAEWIGQYLQMLMAKESVAGIHWAHFGDRFPHYFPNAGLLRTDNTSKQGLETIIGYRRKYWAVHHETG